MSKALGLLSGGLDSTLAAMCLQRQGVEVTCIAYVTPFFGAGKARKAAEKLGVPLIVREIGDMHLEMLKQPRYGYGRNLNPCIDCHAMMFRIAGEVMAQEGFDFLFSGEVLAQRPLSQNSTALQAVAKHSGYPDRILRPLSALLLPETPMEAQGLVDRARLLDIKGRSRKRQQELAAAWGLTEYPPSGGGCLLTEASFAPRLRDLLIHQPGCGTVEVELLKLGRHFRLSPRAKLVLARDQITNESLDQTAPADLTRLYSRDHNGPLGVLCETPDEADLLLAAAIVAGYGKGSADGQVLMVAETPGVARELAVTPLARDQAQLLRL